MDLNKKELSHEVLIETLRAFAPTLSPEGVCNGVTSMWMQAVLTNAEQEMLGQSRNVLPLGHLKMSAVYISMEYKT